MKTAGIMTMAVVFLLSGCSSGPRTPENTQDQVLARIDDMGSRPSWLKESQPFRIEDGKVMSMGMTTIPGDDRVEAAYRIAENNAKAAIAGAIEQRLSFIFQNAEEGTGFDSTQARYIGAEASDLVTSSIRPGQLYWERVATTTDEGDRVTRYKVFALVSMPESDFKRAVIEAARKREGKGGLSADFAKRVDDQWDKFVNEDQPAGDARLPATAQPHAE